MYLKNGGKFLISLKANCIDSTNEPEVVFANEVRQLLTLGTKNERLRAETYRTTNFRAIRKRPCHDSWILSLIVFKKYLSHF